MGLEDWGDDIPGHVPQLEGTYGAAEQGMAIPPFPGILQRGTSAPHHPGFGTATAAGSAARDTRSS